MSGSRAVLRVIEAGNRDECVHCGEVVSFRAANRQRRVIANVYVKRRWDHLEVFHEECYLDAGEPYGPAGEVRPLRSGSQKR